MNYVAPLAEIEFLLRAVAPLRDVCGLDAYAHADEDQVRAVLEEAAKIARNIVAPLNSAADEEGARLENGRVITTPGFREAFGRLAAEGWTSLAVPLAFGGQAMPQLVNTIVAEMIAGASVAFQMALLTGSPAAKVIAVHGNAEQKALWLPQIASGATTATIVITEPQAGSDVGLIRTKAELRAEGTWMLSGTKIFISQGDHDLTDQILHLALARTPGGASGSRGLSLFLVPKRLPDTDGRPGELNGVRAVRLEHKMGLAGSPTCELLFEGAIATMLGREGDGLRNLFAMMNAMRLDVAAQGVGVASSALHKALIYVHDRKQGTGRDGRLVTIVEHPDVRRTLLQMRAWTDGLRALLYTAAWWEDQALASPDRERAKQAAGLVAFLIPLLKVGCSDAAFNMSSLALQLHGGHGYMRDHGVEQLMRDSRVFAIYEGANAIHANDLVMRKLGSDGGAAFRLFFGLVQQEIAASADDARLAEIAAALGRTLRALERSSEILLGRLGSEDAYAAAPLYLQLAVETAVGWMWLKMARAEPDNPGGAMRLTCSRWFAAHVLAGADALASQIERGADILRETTAADFQAW